MNEVESENRLLQVSSRDLHVFTTEPKTRRHLYGMTPTRKRAALLMELFFQNGFVLPAPYYVVKDFLTKKAEFIGLDPRTISAYIGRPEVILREDQLPKTDLTIRYKKSQAKVFKEYLATRTLREKLGFCQQLGYVDFEYRGDEKAPKGFKKAFVVFHHERVPLPYHLKQQPLFTSKKSEVLNAELEVSKDDLCVASIEAKTGSREAYGEASERDRRERRVSKQHTQIRSNLESESILERPQSTKAWLTHTQKAVLEERDRKRLEILDRDLLPHLERSVKKQR